MRTVISRRVNIAAAVWLAALYVGTQRAPAAPPAAGQAVPIPLEQLGAVAGRQYRGDGLSVTATAEQLTFSDTDWFSLGPGVNGAVNALAVSGTNLYVGGQFTSAGGISASNVAKWDGNTWSALGSGVNGSVGALFAVDAVQTGMGRTGEWFGYEGEGISPDIITLAKGLGGGLPLGAMITVGKKVPAFKPGEHGSTFGGNPISCAAANAAIDFIVKKDLLEKVAISGEFLKAQLAKIPGVSEVRGQGLLLGIVLDSNVASAIAAKAQINGLLINAPAKNVIRIAPALIVDKKELREFVEIFAITVHEVLNG